MYYSHIARTTTLVSIICLLLLLAEGKPVSAQDALPSSKDRTEPTERIQASLSSNIEITNEFIKTVVASQGMFVTGTTGGDPSTVNDDNRRLLYGYPDYPSTSFSTVRIIGNGIVSDYALGRAVAPTEAPQLSNNRITTTWVLDGVHVTQRLYFSLNLDTNRNDTTTIEYEIRNNNDTVRQVGVRIMLDTMIGGNDGAPFFILGAGQVTQEFEWLGSGVPAYWIAYESPTFAADSLKGRGQLIGTNLNRPDRFVVSDWPDAISSIWDYQVDPADTVTSDSAVILYYNPVDVAPGATRVIRTSYGIARSGASQQIELVGLEVTQGIQNWNNEVSLIQDRPTYVRAHVQSTGGTVNGMSAELHGRQNGVALPNSPLRPANAGGQINVLQTPQRSNLGDAFYFELPQTWLNGTVELEFKGVGREIVCRESAGDGNDCKVSVEFQQSPAAEVQMVGVTWEEGGEIHTPQEADFQSVVRQIIATFPIPKLNWANLVSIQPVFFSGRPDNILEDATFFIRLNSMIGIQRMLDGCIYNCNKYYLGVIVDPPAGRPHIAGMANGIPGDVASGYVGDLTLPHELGHLAGRRHVNCYGNEAGTDSEYPHSGGRIGGSGDANGVYYGFDFSSLSVKDPTTGDLMSYCWSTWPSNYTYNAIQIKLNERFGSSAMVTASRLSIQAGQPAVIVGGLISLTQWGGELTAIHAVPSPSETSAPSPGSYAIEFRNAFGQRLALHEFAPEEPSEGTVGSFTLLLPSPEGATQILLLRDGHTLDVVNASSNAPTVALTFPNGGEVLAGQTATVSWIASDQDNDPLRYVIQYSADAGATWQTLVVDWSQTSYPLNLSQIKGGNSSIIRVLASDGFHTVSDQSDGTFSISPKAPQVTIDAPADQSFFVADQLVLLRGNGYDTEDGQLVDDSNYAWSSSIDGALGTGKSLAVSASSLSEGDHDVVLTVTDSDGLTTSKDIRITVLRERPLLPATWSVTPSNLQYYVVTGEGSPDAQVLMLRNAGDGTVQWNAYTDREWILLSSLSGNLPVDILVGIDSTSLGAGIYTGTVTLTSPSIAQPQIVPVTLQITDRNPEVIIVTVSQPAIPADGYSDTTLSVQILDTAGRPVSDQVITFTTTIGEIVDQATTNLNGAAEVNLTSSTIAGTAEVMVVSGHLHKSVIVNFVAGPPTSIDLNVSTASIPVDGSSTSTITALVTDAHGNLVPNQSVAFATSLGTMTSPVTTDANGVATTTLTAGTVAGTVQVNATAGSATASVEVQFVAGPPAVIEVSASPAAILANGSSTSAVTALVKDAHGNPVTGQTVAFATTLGAITGSSITEADGKAAAVLTSAQQVGQAQVTASLGELSATTAVAFTGRVFTGSVFVDINQNGEKDTGEPGIANVEVEMTLLALAAEAEQATAAAVGSTWRTQSDAQGNYTFAELPFGQYRLTLYLPTGYAATTPISFTVTLSDDQTSAPGVGMLSRIYLPAVTR